MKRTATIGSAAGLAALVIAIPIISERGDETPGTPVAAPSSVTPTTGANGLITFPPSAPDEVAMVEDPRPHGDPRTAPECQALRAKADPKTGLVKVSPDQFWCFPGALG